MRAANMMWAILLCLCALWYFDATILRLMPQFDGRPSDFTHYYRAGQAISHGNTPFADPEFDYPPLIAFLITPLACLDYVTAERVWFIFSQACLLAAAWVCWTFFGRDWIAACSIACVWAFGGAAPESLALGQAGPLLVLALALAYETNARRQGAAVAAGFGLKFIPGLLGLAFLLERNRRAIAAFITVTLLVVVLPWAALAVEFRGAKAPVNPAYWMGTPATLSWSIPSVLLRALDPPVRGGSLPDHWQSGNSARLRLPRAQLLLSAAAALGVLIMGAIALVIVCRGRLHREQVPWALAGLLSLGLAAAPICWSHYQIMQYPGAAMMLSQTIRLRMWRAAGLIAVCCALLYRIPVAVLTAYYNQHGGWTAASPETLYLWTSVTPFACLGLFCICLWGIKLTCRCASAYAARDTNKDRRLSAGTKSERTPGPAVQET